MFARIYSQKMPSPLCFINPFLSIHWEMHWRDCFFFLWRLVVYSESVCTSDGPETAGPVIVKLMVFIVCQVLGTYRTMKLVEMLEK